MSTILATLIVRLKNKTLASNEGQCLPFHAQSPEGAFTAWQRASCVTLTETRKEGAEKKRGSLSKKKVDKNPGLWLKMKWYDRVHWISSEFKLRWVAITLHGAEHEHYKDRNEKNDVRTE